MGWGESQLCWVLLFGRCAWAAVMCCQPVTINWLLLTWLNKKVTINKLKLGFGIGGILIMNQPCYHLIICGLSCLSAAHGQWCQISIPVDACVFPWGPKYPQSISSCCRGESRVGLHSHGSFCLLMGHLEPGSHRIPTHAKSIRFLRAGQSRTGCCVAIFCILLYQIWKADIESESYPRVRNETRTDLQRFALSPCLLLQPCRFGHGHA